MTKYNKALEGRHTPSNLRIDDGQTNRQTIDVDMCRATYVLWITKKQSHHSFQMSHDGTFPAFMPVVFLRHKRLCLRCSLSSSCALGLSSSHPLTRTETAAIYFIIIITDFSISPLLITPQTCLFGISHVTVWSIGLMLYFSDAKLRFFYFTCTKIIRKKQDKIYLICIKHAFYTNQTQSV